MSITGREVICSHIKLDQLLIFISKHKPFCIPKILMNEKEVFVVFYTTNKISFINPFHKSTISIAIFSYIKFIIFFSVPNVSLWFSFSNVKHILFLYLTLGYASESA